MTDTQWIRLKSTDDTDALSDATIALILAEYTAETETDRRKLALADVYEYLARDDVYESYSRGGISVGKNVLRQRAIDLRAEVGVSVETGTLIHACYEED
jgi:hypothetical protein